MKKTRTFHFKSDVKFKADDLLHAFEKLQDHFKKLREHKDSDLIEEGTMELEVCYINIEHTNGNIKREKLIKIIK